MDQTDSDQSDVTMESCMVSRKTKTNHKHKVSDKGCNVTVLGRAGPPPYHCCRARHTGSGMISKSLPLHKGMFRFSFPPSPVKIIT